MELNLNKELINRCNSVSQFNAGDVLAAQATQTIAEFDDKFRDKKGLNDNQLKYIAERRENFIAFVNEVFNDQLSRRATFVPVNVAGASNYPAEKMAKQANKMFERKFEQYNKLELFIENTYKGIDNLKTLEYDN